ncbi:glycosyltransferase family 2 protein [uncultured Hymenobacter sp.]|uniref:glycosyltransferase family 2 protein n=1 Tax=uncultured Hymenobacter sp. TaxID=170016 RepID=UPI0035C9E607
MALQLPKLSVVVLAYRHEPFLRQALDSVLMQETDFAYEVIVGEDCSPDDTRRIVQEYERRHPTIVRPIYQSRNVGLGPNFRACLAACRGEYIALLEGDDYWTDPHKLRKQVAWLDEHPDFSICFHPVADLHGDNPGPLAPARVFTKDEYTFEDFLTPIYTIVSTGSTVLRNVLSTWPEWLFTVRPIDFPLTVLYAEQGKAKLLPDVMGVYRIHPGGIWSGTPRHLNIRSFLQMYEQLWRHYRRSPHREALRRHLHALYLTTANVYANSGYPAEAARFLGQALRLGPNFGRPGLQGLLGAGLRLARGLLRRRPAALPTGP